MSNDDSDLFRKAMSGAKPIRQDERAPASAKRPRPKAQFSRADESDVLRDSLEADFEDSDVDDGAVLRYHRPHVGRRTMRKLARGNYAVQDEIDLHGMTVEEAKPRLKDFIEYAASRGKTCVRVVHGKGRGSGERGPVLKRNVNRWLRNMDVVLAFVSTRQVDGGTGAIYVLLDKR